MIEVSKINLGIIKPEFEGWIFPATIKRRYRGCETRRVEYRRIVMPIKLVPLCIYLLARGETTGSTAILRTPAIVKGKRSRVLGERLHLDGASVVHFIEASY